MVAGCDELNHPSALQKIRCVTNRQDWLSAQRFQVAFDPLAFGSTDESNGTTPRRGSSPHPFYAHSLIIESFIRCQIVQSMPEWILAYDADVESLTSAQLVCGGVANELAEIEQVRRFDGKLGESVLRLGTIGQDAQRKDRRAAHCLPYTTSNYPLNRGARQGSGLGQTRGHHLKALFGGPELKEQSADLSAGK